MSRKKIVRQYVLNRETLEYDEVEQPSTTKRYVRTAVLYALSSVSVFILSLYLITDVFHGRTPKRMLVEMSYMEWRSRLQLLERRIESADMALQDMERRDNMLYRSVFGMEAIPEDIRNAGYGGVDRYADIRERDYSGDFTSALMRSDILMKKAYIQSKSFDQVALISERAAEMAVCAPTIPPVNYTHVRQASGFGMRVDPIHRSLRRKHKGVDLAPKTGKDGEPIYVTGNGVVKAVGYDAGGYGRYVLVDHGFGYQTRYAHLSKALVEKGQEVHRGQQIAEMGSTGRSTGTHLHYEVIYMGKHVNPVNYYNKDILPEDYAAIIDSSDERPMS
ncbi:MAG TPA: M23 family metallopeptidase [Candidatus Coprenecus stercoravium]|uniref:M23 family metallopeptidase n=1 Tax=Candidatus Coprenecus stercoravium TaxID=2840735 RepID=A0A9D2KAF5_9BACT|nr:M23 family metallopeptidase [Candidatus Coprenecus stercoravium]